ncbi:MAG: MBL fold metallo-hydrolase [Myxococcaceae bacterium]|nr:MBL fold metallo-hydrolase [Myxococcaceae bacterium]
MADPTRAVAGSAPGPWFVDDSCMGCDASRQCAPSIFREHGALTIVARQPESPEDEVAATRALLSCPTGSIGVKGRPVSMDVFPQELEPASGVHLCGFNSPRAYGGNAWFIARPGGNLLVDGPRWTPHLKRRFEALGGLRDVLLTHRDDLGDAERYAAAFGARVWIHETERSAAPFATDVFAAGPRTTLRDGLEVLEVPGHTRGSVMFLLDGRWLFTGDSLFSSRHHGTLHAHRAQCWYSWPEQQRSLASLRGLPVEWVLPGHGGRARLGPGEFDAQLDALLHRMGAPGWVDAW